MAHSTTLRASVTADSATTEGGPATVLIDGADTPVTANGLTQYTPTPGDRLLVQRVGGAIEILQFLYRGTVPSGGSGNLITHSTSDPSGTPADDDEWVKHDAIGRVQARYYGASGTWVGTTVGPDWLTDSLEIVTHLVSPDSTNTRDWSQTGPSSITDGGNASTGGSLANHKFSYWVSAVLPTGLLTRLAGPLDTDLTGSATSTNTQDLSWASVAGATDYRLWRRDLTAGGIDQTILLGSTGTTYTDTGSGWTDGSLIAGVWSSARLDISDEGLYQFDSDDNVTTELSNNGGAIFYQQTTFGTAPGGPVEMAMRVEGPFDTPVADTYVSFLDLSLGTPDDANLTHQHNGDDTFEMVLNAGSGSDSMSLIYTHAGAGNNNLEASVGSYVNTQWDDNDITHSVSPSGTHKFYGPVVIETDTISGMGTVPIGGIMEFGGTTAPTGWLMCDGSAVSRTTYAALFGVFGTTHGAGDGSTTFNLPDRRGRFGIGANGTYPLGTTGGATTHTITTSEMPSHTHTSAAHTHTSAAHTHAAGTLAATDAGHAHAVGSLVTNTTGSGHTHSFSVQWTNTTATGGGTIRVTDVDNQTGGGGSSGTATTSTTGSGHTHGITGSVASGTASISMSGSTASTTPGDTGSTTPGATGSAGSGSAMSILNPYIGMNYIAYAGA